MSITKEIANHVRQVYFGGNWTSSCLKEQLTNITWQQATTKIKDFNTIVTLVYHVNYYVHEVSKVLEGNPLLSSDALSFKHPPINNQEDWNTFLQKVWDDGEAFAILIEQLPNEKLQEDFTDQKYGSYYRNLVGIIEHLHYHLGQIVIIKKLM
jgi:hypothetical protein